jgi:2-oxoglutarate ferredoxin oxidoreductase subunit beta
MRSLEDFMNKPQDLTTKCPITWCPGCGNFAIFGALKQAATQQGWDSSNSVLVAGIGCHGHILNFLKINSFEGLHGRAIPVATGVKIANHRLNVFVSTGDGDCFGEGGNHFIHGCRRNHDITVMIHDNALYALTTGQTSPLSPHGLKTKSTPSGNPDEPFNPITMAIASGATFVARGYAGDIPMLTELIIRANEHKGFSVIDILQPCVTFNKLYTHEFYQQNTYKLGLDYDPKDKTTAFKRSLEWGEKQIPIGIFYEVEKPSYESQIKQISERPLVESSPVRKNLDDLFKKYINLLNF